MATPEAPLREILKSISFTQLPLCHIDPFFVPPAIVRPQLFVYPPVGGSSSGPPTSDVECLRTLALLKFSNYEFDLCYTHEPNMSPNAQLPFLILPDGTAIDSQHIESHLADAVPKVEDGFLAYYELAKHNLAPAVEYLVWVDPVGFAAIGDPGYLARYSAVARYWLGWGRTTSVARKLQSGMPEYGAALDGDVIYENAMRALDSLLVLLGQRDFLSDGGGPGPLDALVFACLNAFLEAPVKSPVRTALTRPGSKLKPLVDYVLRINSTYFANKTE
ncbi:hypothetical protein GGI20_003208 [Coemansia sp. BCRC 34301]|nr:hypothetical protein GGI20_003208 [Coemansia sp. BCRC 34301]